MPRYSYVNGSYVPHSDACVHIEDRGYQFADGVYEVIGCIGGRFADERGHLERLERSMRELSITPPVERETLRFVMRHLLRLNRIRSAAIYIQVTRGVAPRDFKFPAEDVRASLVLTCRPFNFDQNLALEKGVAVATVPDQRWARRDIKTIALLPQALARQKAVDAGAYESWMVDDQGFITEGAASNAWIYKDGTLITHPSGQRILKGVTRTAIFDIARQQGLNIEERQFTPEEAYSAEEAFSSSATALLIPVVSIDGHTIGDGKSGKLVRSIYDQYRKYALDKDYEGQVEWSA